MVAIAVSLVLLVLIGFLGVFVIKSVATPKKIDGINKLIKQQKYSAAQKAAKALIAKDPRGGFKPNAMLFQVQRGLVRAHSNCTGNSPSYSMIPL